MERGLIFPLPPSLLLALPAVLPPGWTPEPVMVEVPALLSLCGKWVPYPQSEMDTSLGPLLRATTGRDGGGNAQTPLCSPV